MTFLTEILGRDAHLQLQGEPLVSAITSPSQTRDDLNGLFRSLRQSARERRLDSARHVPRGRPSLPPLPPDPNPHPDPATPQNRRHGHAPKTVRGQRGELTRDTPRDRLGTGEPQRIPKPQRRLSGCDEKILALDAKGPSSRAMPDIVQERYGVDVAPTLVSALTADLDTEVSPWRQRRLDAVWPSSPSTALGFALAATTVGFPSTSGMWRWA